jgi:hypothetical protein
VVICEPWVRKVSPKVKVLFGYRDAHARLEVVAPIGIVVPVRLTAFEIEKIKGAFDRAYTWAMKPEAERKAGKGDQEEILDPRGKVTYGFPDGHAVISVRIVAKISPWIPLDVSRDEVIDGKPIMHEIHQWTLLPQDVRDMQSTLA